jgi:hypothetical protein
MTDTLTPPPSPEPVVDTPDDATGLLRTIGSQRAELDRVNDLLRKYDSAINIIADALNEEAMDRDWCDEYADFIEKLNGRLPAAVHKLTLPTARYRISFTVEDLTKNQATRLEGLIDGMLVDHDMVSCRNFDAEED